MERICLQLAIVEGKTVQGDGSSADLGGGGVHRDHWEFVEGAHVLAVVNGTEQDLCISLLVHKQTVGGLIDDSVGNQLFREVDILVRVLGIDLKVGRLGGFVSDTQDTTAAVREACDSEVDVLDGSVSNDDCVPAENPLGASGVTVT